MRIFLDTSVLVPVFLLDHPHHQHSIRLFTRCQNNKASCAAHSLAEVYATLTRIPKPHTATPEQALACLEAISERFQVISLDGAEYLAAIRGAAANQIAGGTTYDVLIAACALRSGADRIYTWNNRHFNRFGPDIVQRLSSPEAD